jgi:hypothetical protein
MRFLARDSLVSQEAFQLTPLIEEAYQEARRHQPVKSAEFKCEDEVKPVVVTGDREVLYSLTLPDVAEASWKVPAKVRRGVPKASEQAASATELWPWLAALGALGLLIDWLLFGRSRAFRLRAAGVAAVTSWKAPWRKAS